jgi:ribosomal protein S18 acetylase RimI-like enzyme
MTCGAVVKENLEILEITNVNEKEIADALEIMNRTQGEGLFNRHYLESKILDNDSLVLFVLKCNEVIGVGCAEIINKFDYYTSFDSEISTRLKDKVVGSLCTSCVKEEFQGQGIGQEVARKRMKWLSGKGCDSVLGISWQSGLANTSDRVLPFRECRIPIAIPSEDKLRLN